MRAGGARDRVAGPRALRRRDPGVEGEAQRRGAGAQLPDARRSSTASPTSPATRSRSRRRRAETDADVIVMAGVHFMAETAKILSPEKTVLIPDTAAGCSLAASITAADVRLLRERYPDAPVVTYVNTSAEVKAESDICCTSANAVEVVESLGVAARDLPAGRVPRPLRGDADEDRDRPLAGPLRGPRALHRRRDPAFRAQHPGVIVLAHPECPPDVLAAADYVGSTAGMVRHLESARPVAGGAGDRVLDGATTSPSSSRRPSSCGPATSART